MGKLYALHDPDLEPKVQFFPGLGEGGMAMNTDACIELARLVDTPAARRIYRSYLKHRRRLERQGQAGPDMRFAAYKAALRDSGITIVEGQSDV